MKITVTIPDDEAVEYIVFLDAITELHGEGLLPMIAGAKAEALKDILERELRKQVPNERLREILKI